MAASVFVRWCLAFAIGWAGFAAPLSAATMHVFFLAGQSNAGGHGNASVLPGNVRVQSDVRFFSARPEPGAAMQDTFLRPGSYHPGFYGLELPFAYYLSRFFRTHAPGDRIAIIKYAVAGTSVLRDWKADGTASAEADGTTYRRLQEIATVALATLRRDAASTGDRVQIAGLIWVQGEGDVEIETNDPGQLAASIYAENLAAFVDDVRATFGSGMPVFVARYSRNQTHYAASPACEALRSAQDEVGASVAGVTVIDTDAPAFRVGDGVHYDDTGLRALGLAFAGQAARRLDPRANVRRLDARPVIRLAGSGMRETGADRITLRGTV